MSDTPRLIEHAFPLKQASLDSVHEKNVRHGHISTLHIWPARRPLAACRAALIATLLPDPGTPEKRKELCEKIGGKVIKKIEKKKMPNGQIVEREKEITEGGILHWIGAEPESGGTKKKEAHRALLKQREDRLRWFRDEIRKAYGDRPPKVLDPFAGGGAIPLEAMRLGCDVTAIDINPVAWFILKCTLEYPQRLAGKTYPLPEFILHNEDFMNAFYKAQPHLAGRTKQTKKQKEKFAEDLFLKDKADSGRAPKADLAWHVRAWGQRVLDQARPELARYYPTYADFEPLDLKNPKPYEKQPMRFVPLKIDGTLDVESLNTEFSEEYLADKRNPRWVAKPTVAYLWARTVTCKNCRAGIPLLKTLWLHRKEKHRTLLEIEREQGSNGVLFVVKAQVASLGGNAAKRREHDRKIGQGTMTKSGAVCPCCKTISKHEDIQLDGKAGKLGRTLVAVVVQGTTNKEFRVPHENEAWEPAGAVVDNAFRQIPLGVPGEEISPDRPSPNTRGASGLPRYGFTTWGSLFTERQLFALGTILQTTRSLGVELENFYRHEGWAGAISAYLLAAFDKYLTNSSQLCSWNANTASVRHTFARFVLPMVWDFVEVAPYSDVAGSYSNGLEWVTAALHFSLDAASPDVAANAVHSTAAGLLSRPYDCIVTDPPYYDAIPYSDLMDFYHVWLRRGLRGTGHEIEPAFENGLGPKRETEFASGELIDQPSRFGNDLSASKKAYEDGMAEVFRNCGGALTDAGRMVVVFANKQPSAWETLASSLIRAGFVVDATWPIQTERASRSNALSAAALSSSVWLVCKKRPVTARPGWDNQVLEEMRENISGKLREFWDAGIRGPDFVWAATGPALEAYSKHPVVKKANEPGPLTVSEFLAHVRRMVVDFVVGRVLAGEKEGEAELAAADRLDEATAYYLLHRHDFGMDEAPAGACILYAISCGLSDKDLADTWDLISFTKGKSADEIEEEPDADAEDDPDTEEESGGKVKLKTWAQRKSRSLGYEAPGGKPVPLIDRIHCLMHLWRAGDLSKVDEYFDSNGLRRHELFKRLLQSLIELSPHGSDERSLLESISNHIQARGAVDDRQPRLAL
jgi:adenine-specific DNA methylase